MDVISDEEEVEDSFKVNDIDEGLDIIEKDIYDILGVSESRTFNNSELKDKRITLVRMDDPYTELRPGDMGTITGEDDAGHILVQWDKGSTLSVVPGVDDYGIHG